ncbi:MFS transporter [Homoserinibacter sp. GY 40078]|uniref:MFS transporter n=1 Tax=Homoserinibacter sp. GY 40078 TaxID=2603275 RepID=UPI0011C77E89|nr:MFS transporter [Homoserinibacter sp. GY 40078]TXK19277.1 MFS transporter [Homoserinibacter sp. GY 40078]
MTRTLDGGFPTLRLLVLTGAIFASVSSEFLPTGLLPEMSAELGVSESRIGLLVTVFAGTVVLSTAPLTILTRRYSRKWLMVLLLGIFALTNVLCAIAPSYEFLLGARVLGGLAHGLFWAVTGPYAALLVPRHQLARAISLTNAGGTLAFIFGVPLGTFLGHALGWRFAFAAMAATVLVFMVLVVLYLPPVSHLVPLATGEIPLPTRKDRSLPAVIIVCVSVTLVATGHNLFYTYIAPWAIQVGGVEPDWVSGLLFAYGAAGAIGLALGGAFGDRYPRGAVNVALAGLTASVLFLAAFGTEVLPVVIGMAVWSASFGGVPALMHSRVLHSASDRIRDLAAAWLTTAFNLAIGGGALIGGGLLDAYGIQILPWIASAVILVGLVFVLATDRARIAAHPS